jgi:hypothetical protein
MFNFLKKQPVIVIVNDKQESLEKLEQKANEKVAQAERELTKLEKQLKAIDELMIIRKNHHARS